MAAKIVGVKGMNDVLPADMPLWQAFERAWWDTVGAYGYQGIRTPIVEQTQLFVRGIGEVTDIVEKEMYSFVDQLNGEHLTLRPENTAAVVRASIEHSLLYDGPKRLAYVGPMFRHERPQRGRYRQFHQAGAEAMGWHGPDVDAEQIIMLARLWSKLGLRDVALQINCLGQTDERKAHRDALVTYFEAHADQLDADAQRRLHSNPLRILDTKNPTMQAMVEAAPKLIDYLGEASRAHFDGVCALLTAAGLAFDVNPRLVRGLDYYNLTVFEWVTTSLGAQGTICGGGRYDPLIEMIGGKPAPACGFAIGIERVLELMRDLHGVPASSACDVYLVHAGANSTQVAMQLAEALRTAGKRVITHAGGGSFKSQMKKADASGAQWAVILGDDEIQAGQATVKDLRASADGSAPQRRLPWAELAQALAA